MSNCKKGSDWDWDWDCDCDKNDCKKEDCCVFTKHPKPKKILFECGTKPEDAIFDTSINDQTFILNRVLLDTTCLCKPEVKIEFSSLICYEIVPDQRSWTLDLRFDLVKICDGMEEVLQYWHFTNDFELQSGDQKFDKYEVSTPFTVTYCDRECPDCCKYEMRVTSVQINDSSPEPDFEKVNVIKPDISAFAQGICC